MAMKLVVIGGGSSYTPELIEGVINHQKSLPITEVVLADIEMGREKLFINTEFTRRMIKKAGLSIEVKGTLDRKEALFGADFIITQIRVGGLDARERDERIPLKYGMIGQETTGIGGCLKALRTIPVILDICKDIEKLCPEDLDCRFIGLNHLSVMNHAYLSGEDRIKDVLNVFNRESVVKNIEKNEEMDEIAKALGCMLSPYLQYFYLEKKMFHEERQQALGLLGTRANQVKKVEQELFLKYQDENLKEKPEALSKRGGARYSQAAINLIDSIYNDTKDVQVVDVQNQGLIPQLLEDAVIETNCVIGKDGAKPLRDTQVPREVLGLICQAKSYENFTIEAALSGDRNKAFLAFLNHPLVHDAVDAKGALEEMLEANREYLPAFFPG